MYEDIEIVERVDTLETVLGQFIVQTNTGLNRLSREMREFKNEMREFKDEMRGFKNEMSSFKDEMSGFKTEVRQEQRHMNKKWGELANKMGTLVEDIIAPAVRPVVEKYFQCEVLGFYVNVRKKDKALGIQGEFDVIAVSDANVFLVDAKSRIKREYLYDFIENIEKFKKLFPEYSDKKLVPIFSSLRFEQDMISHASSEKIYVMAFREWEYMDILNFSELSEG